MKDNCWTILEKNDFEKFDFQKNQKCIFSTEKSIFSSKIFEIPKMRFWNFHKFSGYKKCILVASEDHISSLPNMKANCWTVLEKNDFENFDFQKNINSPRWAWKVEFWAFLKFFWCFWSAWSQKRFSSSISRFTGCQYGPETLSECTFYRPRACTFLKIHFLEKNISKILDFFSRNFQAHLGISIFEEKKWNFEIPKNRFLKFPKPSGR